MSLTPAQARNIALAAQGFSGARPQPTTRTATTRRRIQSIIQRLGLFQIDSVNVVQRAHFMPLFSRVGPYDTSIFEREWMENPRTITEYWAHEASLIDVRLWPALRLRMDSGQGMWSITRRIATERPELLKRVLDEIHRRGALTARQISDDAPSLTGRWGWNRSDVKRALEYHFHAGRLAIAKRTPSFERVYDSAERVIPEPIYRSAPLSDEDSYKLLVDHAARAHGVGSAQCIADYFRLPLTPTQIAIEALVRDGALEATRIGGCDRPVYLHSQATRSPTVSARSLLSPFDPVVFERRRVEKLFDFRYRIEIYVPAARRSYGYYVLPFLLGNRIVARVDLKADRQKSALIVRGAWAEPATGLETATGLALELTEFASWLGLTDIVVTDRGDLAASLRRSIG